MGRNIVTAETNVALVVVGILAGCVLIGFALGRASVDADAPTAGYIDMIDHSPPYRLCYSDGKQWAAPVGDRCKPESATK
ncbi:MAG: hypothetical protein KGL39_29635 [Patescibacteria group bacterium]|nr:hypothetical protein [Patescibacteria group bacterium]